MNIKNSSSKGGGNVPVCLRDSESARVAGAEGTKVGE